MLISVDEARHYAAHPSNHEFGFTESDLTDGFLYYAQGGVCMAFHPMPYPGVWMAHVFSKPEGRGKITEPTIACLNEFWAAIEPDHLIAWIPPRRRHAAALAKRTGWKLEGRMVTGIEMYGWRPEWLFLGH